MAVRCRTGTFANSEFGKAPDLRRSTDVLRRVRGKRDYQPRRSMIVLFSARISVITAWAPAARR